MRKNRAEVFKKKGLISITEIYGFVNCRRYVYLQLKGLYVFVPPPEKQKIFDGGIRIHDFIQQEYPKTTSNKVLIEQRLEYKGISGRADMVEIGNNTITVIEIKSGGEWNTYTLYPSMEKQTETYSGIIGTIGLDGVEINKDTKIFCEVWKAPRDIDLNWTEVSNAIKKTSIDNDIYGALDYAVAEAAELKRCIKKGILPEKSKAACKKCDARKECIIAENLYREKLRYGG